MKNTARKLALIALLTASALSMVGCDADNQDVVNAVGSNPIAQTADRLTDAYNHETGITITPPCVDGCADEVINQLKKIGK